MTTDIPIGRIDSNVQTSTPVVSDSTLVDDTVALVDGATALVGGPSTISVTGRTKSKQTASRIKVKISR